MATTLHRFKDFPIKVRAMIWKLAVPDPRIVDFRLRILKATPDEWYKTDVMLDKTDPRMKSVCLFLSLLVFSLISIFRRSLNIHA